MTVFWTAPLDWRTTVWPGCGLGQLFKTLNLEFRPEGCLGGSLSFIVTLKTSSFLEPDCSYLIELRCKIGKEGDGVGVCLEDSPGESWLGGL